MQRFSHLCGGIAGSYCQPGLLTSVRDSSVTVSLQTRSFSVGTNILVATAKSPIASDAFCKKNRDAVLAASLFGAIVS